ncbi:MAG: hypothetical protein V4773_16950 [Verrucomicrobiota bacterium]
MYIAPRIRRSGNVLLAQPLRTVYSGFGCPGGVPSLAIVVLKAAHGSVEGGDEVLDPKVTAGLGSADRTDQRGANGSHATARKRGNRVAVLRA